MTRRDFLQTGVTIVSRRNSRFSTVALMLWVGLGAIGQAEAGGVLQTPAGLKPGDQFRFMFVTDGTSMAISTNLADYDNFVNTQAQGATYNGQTVQWLAIGSALATDAVDHIGETDTPVYSVIGRQVATSTRTQASGGLWSGTLESAIEFGINGNLVHGQVWTGTSHGGLGITDNSLGSEMPAFGATEQTNAGWTDSGIDSEFNAKHFYGISQVLTVALTQQPVPEPSSIVMLGTALLATAYARRFRNAKFSDASNSRWRPGMPRASETCPGSLSL